MEELLTWILDLEDYVNFSQGAVWVTIGIAFGWGSLRLKLKKVKIKVNEAKSELNQLKTQKEEWEKSIESLQNEIGNASLRLPQEAINRASKEDREGNYESAIQLLLKWWQNESPLIAETCRQSAKWMLDYSSKKDNTGNLAEAKRAIDIGRVILPDDLQMQNLESEIIGRMNTDADQKNKGNQ